MRAGATSNDLVKVRRKGSGRPRHEVVHPELADLLEKLVDPVTQGDPESPLRWTSKSTHTLSIEMFREYGIRVGDKTIARLLRGLGYSLQATHKTVEGAQHPDRNAQFEYINDRAKECLNRGVPFISVDTTKKELVGNFKNAVVRRDDVEGLRRGLRLDADLALNHWHRRRSPNILPVCRPDARSAAGSAAAAGCAALSHVATAQQSVAVSQGSAPTKHWNADVLALAIALFPMKTRGR